MVAKRVKKPRQTQQQHQRQAVIVNVNNSTNQKRRSKRPARPVNGKGGINYSTITRPIEMLANSAPYNNPTNIAPVVNTLGGLPAMFREPIASSVLTMPKSSPAVQPKSVDDEKSILTPKEKLEGIYGDESKEVSGGKNPMKGSNLSELMTELIKSPIYKKQQGTGGGGKKQLPGPNAHYITIRNLSEEDKKIYFNLNPARREFYDKKAREEKENEGKQKVKKENNKKK